MALTPSTMVPLGTPMPPFSLPDTDGKLVDSASLQGKPVLVAFICNHCPYVKHIAEALAVVGNRLTDSGMAVIAVHSNDWQSHSADSPACIREERQRLGHRFPALLDETQQVAQAFSAQCTPDFFVYDSEHRLVYRGQFDSTRPGKGLATGEDLEAACHAVLAGRTPESDQTPSIGCNIKWKPGMTPA